MWVYSYEGIYKSWLGRQRMALVHNVVNNTHTTKECLK